MEDDLVMALERGGFVAAEEEAAELRAAAPDAAALEAMLARRVEGEPLAWITGTAEFCGLTVRVARDVYVPRFQTEALAELAAQRVGDGAGVELCCGSGAVAAVMLARGASRVVASDLSETAVACARSNGVEAYAGDLFAPLPHVEADVVFAVVPYVPTGELPLLQRDTFTYETPLSYDGGADGLDVLRRVVAEAPAWLKPGGLLVVELGGDQASRLDLSAYARHQPVLDEDGDLRGLLAEVY